MLSLSPSVWLWNQDKGGVRGDIASGGPQMLRLQTGCRVPRESLGWETGAPQVTPQEGGSFLCLTWKTLAAETRQARAEERVAPKMPAVIRGAKADTMLMLCGDSGD